MPFSPKVGLVFGFYFLWKRDRLAGREFVTKPHPCVAFNVNPLESQPGEAQLVRVLGISHTAPEVGEDAIEIPQGIKRDLKLDGRKQWVYTCHANVVRWWDHVEPVGHPPVYLLGEMNPKFLASVIERVLDRQAANAFAIYPRKEA